MTSPRHPLSRPFSLATSACPPSSSPAPPFLACRYSRGGADPMRKSAVRRPRLGMAVAGTPGGGGFCSRPRQAQPQQGLMGSITALMRRERASWHCITLHIMCRGPPVGDPRQTCGGGFSNSRLVRPALCSIQHQSWPLPPKRGAWSLTTPLKQSHPPLPQVASCCDVAQGQRPRDPGHPTPVPSRPSSPPSPR